MQLSQLFKDLGLEDKEPEVLTVLISIPGAQPASVIAKKAKLNRTTTYKALMKLADQGLVTRTMLHGIVCFYVEEPEKRLEKLVQDRKDRIETLQKNLLSSIPLIRELQKEELIVPKMRFYEGFEGVKRVYEDTLIEGETIYSIEDSDSVPPELLDFFDNNYIPRRVEKGIQAYMLTPKSTLNSIEKKKDATSRRETRFLPKSKGAFEIEINIYGNKTAFFSYKPEEQFGVILESRTISTALRSIFEICWNISK